MGLALGDGRDLSLAGLAGRAGTAGRAGVVLAAAEGDDVADLQAIVSVAGGLAAGAAACILDAEALVDFGGDLAAILTNLSRNDILFVDEIHRMPIAVEEVLYPAMEDFKLDLVIGQGPAARTVKIDLEPFTLVGATTRMGLISAPLRGRFGILSQLEFYTPAELARVVLRTAHILGIAVTPDGAEEIGRRSRGTPRIANRLLRRVRDFAMMGGHDVITAEQAAEALRRMDVDEIGLDRMDRRLLEVMITHYDGGPVGLKTLAVACSEEVRTIEEIYEPYLIQCGLLKRTPRGRMVTAKAYRHLNLLLR